MNIAVMAYSYAAWIQSGKTDLPRVIGHLRDLGVGGIEMMHALVRDEVLPAIRDALVKVQPIGVACYDLRVETIAAALKHAASLGAKRVMVTPILDVAGIAPSDAREQ